MTADGSAPVPADSPTDDHPARPAPSAPEAEPDLFSPLTAPLVGRRGTPWGPRRVVLVVAAVVVTATLALASLGFRVERTTPPVADDSDGLPAELVSGQEYTARFTVDFPADWPVEETGVEDTAAGTTRAMLVVLARGVPDDEPAGSPESTVIYCSSGIEHAAGERAQLACPFTAPSPGPFELVLQAGEPGVMLNDESVRMVVETYEHTVVAAG